MYYLANFSDKPYGIWTSNRSTPIVVGADSRSEALKKARKKMKKGYGTIKNAKALKGKDAKDARQGKWVRTRSSGLSPVRGGAENKLKARKQMTNYRKGLRRKSIESLQKKK